MPLPRLNLCRPVFSLALALSIPSAFAAADPTEASINKQMQGLRALPTDQRPAASLQLAKDIRTLPAGLPKVRLANGLVGLTTEVDAGAPTFQAVADTLSQALTETPVPPKSPDAPPSSAYMNLARLVRYMHVTTALDAPQLTKASQILVADEDDVRKADFTLKDLHGKKFTLYELKGKIVLVNFWATWCPPCRHEMPNLDAIYTHFKDQLVILSITDEEAYKVNTFINQASYHPPVLLDSDQKVHKMFHINGIPQSFVYDKDGKFVDETIDELTQRQFLQLLAKAGLHP